jgi:hypothetical protein
MPGKTRLARALQVLGGSKSGHRKGRNRGTACYQPRPRRNW